MDNPNKRSRSKNPKSHSKSTSKSTTKSKKQSSKKVIRPQGQEVVSKPKRTGKKRKRDVKQEEKTKERTNMQQIDEVLDPLDSDENSENRGDPAYHIKKEYQQEHEQESVGTVAFPIYVTKHIYHLSNVDQLNLLISKQNSVSYN